MEHIFKPSPYNFEEYLTWACNQFECIFAINITKKLSGSICEQSDRSKKKTNQTLFENDSSAEITIIEFDDVINITTVYDKSKNLIKLQFVKNKTIQRMVIKVIGLIVKYHPYLTNLTINKGLNSLAIYELSKWLSSSNITDICLDNSVVPDANYHLLLEKNSLRRLSLARCDINDKIVKNMALKLIYPLPASKTLTILVLSSNKITDLGAKYLAEALRTNRQLAYLNLADNWISDEGAIAILDVLKEFQISNEELISARSRLINYLKERIELTSQIIIELQTESTNRKRFLRRSSRSTCSITSTSSRRKNKDEEPSLISIDSDNLDAKTSWYDKAKSIAEKKIGKFIDPFSSVNRYSKKDHEFCYGNNNLAYLSIAYNDVSYFTVKKLLNVLLRQKVLDRTPKGLVNVCIEGNNIPSNCVELNEIDDLLDASLSARCGNQYKKMKAKVSKLDLRNEK